LVSEDFWDWSLRVYAGEGVAEACLALQDDHGQCVPLLLWAVWAGDATVTHVDRAVKLARDWQPVILPLREVRRRLKMEVSPGDEADRLVLRAQVKAAELQAEKALMLRLEALTSGKSALNQDLAVCLRCVALSWGGEAPEDALSRLAEALTKGDFVRYNP